MVSDQLPVNNLRLWFWSILLYVCILKTACRIHCLWDLSIWSDTVVLLETILMQCKLASVALQPQIDSLQLTTFPGSAIKYSVVLFGWPHLTVLIPFSLCMVAAWFPIIKAINFVWCSIGGSIVASLSC